MENETCPKCGYRRQARDADPYNECPRCGIVFTKYAKHHPVPATEPPIESAVALPTEEAGDAEEGWTRRVWDRLWELPEQPDEIALAAQAGVLLVLAIYGLRLITYRWQFADINASFLHLVNLPIHEFGHVLFRPFGEWMTFLGGSLFQCLLPALIGVGFLWKMRNPFGAAFCLWWVGDNFLDVAPYIGDARLMALPLTGEWNDDVVELHAERHDWHNILGMIGGLRYDTRLAAGAHFVGAALIVLACLWAGRWLWLAWKKARGAST